MAEIDLIIHTPARLRIMSALSALPPRVQIDFSTLGKSLDLTDGNLGAHLQTLEEAGYIRAEKSFIIHTPARLRIMSALSALPPRVQIDFSTLGKSLDLTDGNLGAHLQTLEEAGY